MWSIGSFHQNATTIPNIFLSHFHAFLNHYYKLSVILLLHAPSDVNPNKCKERAANLRLMKSPDSLSTNRAEKWSKKKTKIIFSILMNMLLAPVRLSFFQFHNYIHQLMNPICSFLNKRCFAQLFYYHVLVAQIEYPFSYDYMLLLTNIINNVRSFP